MSNDPKRPADAGVPRGRDDTRVPIEVAIAEEAPESADEAREFIAELVDVREELIDLLADD